MREPLDRPRAPYKANAGREEDRDAEPAEDCLGDRPSEPWRQAPFKARRVRTDREAAHEAVDREAQQRENHGDGAQKPARSAKNPGVA